MKVETIKKTQTLSSGNEKFRNSIRPTETSFTNRIEEMEEKISVIEDMIEVRDT